MPTSQQRSALCPPERTESTAAKLQGSKVAMRDCAQAFFYRDRRTLADNLPALRIAPKNSQPFASEGELHSPTMRIFVT